MLLQVMQIVYDKNPEMREVIDASMIEVCAEEDVSPEQGFFILSLSLSQRLLKKKNLSKSVEEIKKQLKKIFGGYTKWRKFLVVIVQVFSFKGNID